MTAAHVTAFKTINLRALVRVLESGEQAPSELIDDTGDDLI